MLKLLVLINLIIIIVSFTVSPYLISQVDSSPADSSPSSDDDDDDNSGSGPQDNSLQDDSDGTDGSSDGSGDDDNGDNGFEQNLIGDDDGASVDEEPPTSTERGGNPLEGLNLRNLEKEKADCENYLKSLGGGGDETSAGDIIVDPFETKEEYCKRILGAGSDVRNMTTLDGPVNTGLINNGNNKDDVTGQSIVNCGGDTGIIIKEEGMPSRPQPQPQPQPNPPQQPPSPGGC